MKKENLTQNKEARYFFEPLKMYVKENNLTLKQLAKRIGVSEYVISRIFNHKPLQQLRPLVKVVKFFDISLDKFLMFDKKRNYIPKK